jgi:hemerythrin superfamily protein
MATKKSTPAKRAPTKRAKKRDAIDMLKADHAEVKKLYKQYQKLVNAQASADERSALAMNICSALTLHATLEESILYPAAREAIDDQEIMDHADVEHASAKDLIAQIESTAPDESHYDAKVCVLCEYVMHHVKEEEEQMFPKLRKAGLDLMGLGTHIEEAKAALLDGDVTTNVSKNAQKSKQSARAMA